MFKKILLILALICMFVFPISSQTGNYTTNEYFYLPEYGAYGTDEYDEYNLYMQKADTQIKANKDGIADIDLSLYYLKTAINSLSKVESIYSKNITDSDELASALADYYLKTAIDSLSEVESIYSKNIIDSTELAAFTGQENIVTLGTIATGTWQGTAIADAYIPDDITITESDPNVDTQGEIEAILTYALDDTAGDGDTNKLWSANKIFDQLALHYLKTEVDTQGEVEAIWGVELAHSGANTDITSLLNTALVVGRDSTDKIKFTIDNIIVFRVNNIDKMSLISTGELSMAGGSIGFSLQQTTGDGATQINWRYGNKFRFTFGAQNETITFVDPSNPCTLMLTIIQDGTGSRTITWPEIKWAGGTEPTLTTTANARDKVALDWDGTQYDGMVALDFK